MTIYRYLLCVSKLSRYASKNNNLTLQNIEKNVFPTRLNASCKKIKILPSTKNCPKIISLDFLELFPLFYAHFYDIFTIPTLPLE